MHHNIEATKKEIPVPMRVVLLDAKGGKRHYLDAYVILLLVEWTVDVIHYAQLTTIGIDIDLSTRRLKGGVPVEKRLYASTYNRFPQNVAAWVVRESPMLGLEMARAYGYVNIVATDAEGKPLDSHLDDATLLEITQALSMMDRGDNAPTVDKAPDAYKPAGDPLVLKERKVVLPGKNQGSMVVIGPGGKPLTRKAKAKNKSKSASSRKTATAKSGGSKKAAIPQPPVPKGKKGQKVSLAEAVRRVNPDMKAAAARS